jgi:hypothetical protein
VISKQSKGGTKVSKEKKERVIHVDELIIHAKEVKIISPQVEDDIRPRNPWNIFGDRPNRIGNLDVKEEIKEETTLVKDDLVEDEKVIEEKVKSEEVIEPRKGPRWI